MTAPSGVAPAPARTRSVDAPRVVILCATVWSVRNVVHSGLLDALRASGVQVQPIIGFDGGRPLADERSTGDSSPLLGAVERGSQRGKPTWEALLRASFARRHRLASYRIFNRWLRRDASPWQRVRNLAVEALSVPGSVQPVLDWQAARLEQFVRRRRDLSAVRAQLEQLNPDLLVSTACIAGEEQPYLLAARDLGIRTFGCILSFDNLTSRTMLPVFDDYAVWNERMRSQVLSLYPGRDAERVHITGTPQFDFHARAAYRESRAATARRLGLEPDARYVLYAANSVFFTPSEPLLVAELARRFANEPTLAHHRIVVRLHPLDDYGRWDRALAHDGRVIVNRPWDSAAGAFDVDDQTRLIGTVLHADACLNIASTMSLDAAALDTPVVCVGFAGERGGREDRLCRDVYGTEHYRHIVASGGVRVARDMDELVSETAAYVRNRARDQQARRALAASEIGLVDGQATARLAASIRDVAGEAHAQRSPRRLTQG